MPCPFCTSSNQRVFAAEVNIRFPGLINAGESGVLVFPRLLVCLDCGSSMFITPASELAHLARANAQVTNALPDRTASKDASILASACV
jgi:hypothetical protein